MNQTIVALQKHGGCEADCLRRVSSPLADYINGANQRVDGGSP